MNSVQGAHYKLIPGEQHHQRAIRLSMNWYQGNITKYAERAPHKGQLIEDLIKVIDYASMWLAYEGGLTVDQLERLDLIIAKVGNQSGKIPTPNPDTTHRETGER